MSAREAGQLTLIFSGGGDGPRRGLLHVEQSEGSNPELSMISMTLPKLNCKRESCATFDVIRKDGTIAPLGGIPKGKFTLEVPLSAITGSSDPIARPAGGPYRILVEAFLEADDGEHKALMEGVVYVSVLKSGYVGLSCDGADTAWSVSLAKKKGCSAHYSTKMRTALCGECQ